MLCDHKIFFSPADGVFLFMGGGYTIYAFPACYRKMLCGTENFVFVQLYCVFVFCTRIGLFFGGLFQIAAGF
jgi:hypothetical protein